MRSLIVIVIIACIAIVGAGTVVYSTPCQQEDSNNCYWDAQVRGNGLGQSFVTILDHTFYL